MVMVKMRVAMVQIQEGVVTIPVAVVELVVINVGVTMVEVQKAVTT